MYLSGKFDVLKANLSEVGWDAKEKDREEVKKVVNSHIKEHAFILNLAKNINSTVAVTTFLQVFFSAGINLMMCKN